MAQLIGLDPDDWLTILAILDVKKGKIVDREDVLKIQRIHTTIKQQIKEDLINGH